MTGGRHLWIDASAGIAGDMLLGALLDAGADLGLVQRAVDAVVPGSVRLTTTVVTRAGLRARRAHVDVLTAGPPRRTWRDIRELLDALDAPVRTRALAVFARLADAEAHVHGTPVDDVHFHEVGALDSIADVVGVCAALENLSVTTVSAGEVALGSGTARTAHGELPVPVPAVTHLALGWQVRGGGPGELATPTGMAALRTLATGCETLPSMVVEAVGVGAGSRDTPDHPNVVRVMLGRTTAATETAVLIEANVDDLDPRLWPGVLTELVQAGAADAWLTPIVMKKGRPAHTLSVLSSPGYAAALRDLVFDLTTTLGVRETTVRKYPLARTFVGVDVRGRTIAIKIGHRDGTIVRVMPEFDEVAALACDLGRPEQAILAEAHAAAAAEGLTPGARLPA
ncbi:nickel pincer cofactor biosynthesis protein LarC [Actinoplanes sp. N902-109]|uniref:nickel pincer cofactor biosynthesis protein LarC n=1 Tax=Actinoplanes sp. (strain N902-109) TaxID=649831 RepID=UPI0003295F59|nr:nickel pincer cofactor biosynthesis protein LarC [Actinoplanes sp. N902-109]AGL19859.1 hypothetical protein L083_6349 [Actinoplanes sp. N902-109]